MPLSLLSSLFFSSFLFLYVTFVYIYILRHEQLEIVISYFDVSRIRDLAFSSSAWLFIA